MVRWLDPSRNFLAPAIARSGGVAIVVCAMLFTTTPGQAQQQLRQQKPNVEVDWSVLDELGPSPQPRLATPSRVTPAPRQPVVATPVMPVAPAPKAAAVTPKPAPEKAAAVTPKPAPEKKAVEKKSASKKSNGKTH